jgi:hypothetical protein
MSSWYPQTRLVREYGGPVYDAWVSDDGPFGGPSVVLVNRESGQSLGAFDLDWLEEPATDRNTKGYLECDDGRRSFAVKAAELASWARAICGPTVRFTPGPLSRPSGLAAC